MKTASALRGWHIRNDLSNPEVRVFQDMHWGKTHWWCIARSVFSRFVLDVRHANSIARDERARFQMTGVSRINRLMVAKTLTGATARRLH
jgi:hypothetical protein